MDDRKAFWTSLPGILTGIAAVLTAIVGLIGLFHQTRGTDQTPPEKFRIEEVIIRAEPPHYEGPCPVEIKFSGRISVAGGGGKVSYKYLRSNGAALPIHTLTFDSAGSKKVVPDSWTVGRPNSAFSGWEAIETFDPQSHQSEKATVRVTCR